MLKIWGQRKSPNVQKVLWAAEELELAYEQIDVGGPFGGVDAPEYRAKNPGGLIPTLEDDGFVLWESSAIVRYLAAKDPQARLSPAGLQARALVDQWVDWQIGHQGPAVRPLAMLLRPGAATPADGEIIRAAAAAEAVMRRLDSELATRPFVAGDRFTIADIVNGVIAHRWKTLPIDRPTLSGLDAWHLRFTGRPAFQAAVGFG